MITAQEIRIPVCYQQLSPSVAIFSLKKLQFNPFAKKTQFIAREKLGRVRKDTLKEQQRLLIQFHFLIFSYLCKSCPFNEIIELPHSSLLRETLDILEKILCLGFKESSVVCVSERMGPEGANVDPQDLWRVDHLSQGPHECTINPHQLLRVHLVSLIKHHANLVVLAPE